MEKQAKPVTKHLIDAVWRLAQKDPKLVLQRLFSAGENDVGTDLFRKMTSKGRTYYLPNVTRGVTFDELSANPELLAQRTKELQDTLSFMRKHKTRYLTDLDYRFDDIPRKRVDYLLRYGDKEQARALAESDFRSQNIGLLKLLGSRLLNRKAWQPLAFRHEPANTHNIPSQHVINSFVNKDGRIDLNDTLTNSLKLNPGTPIGRVTQFDLTPFGHEILMHTDSATPLIQRAYRMGRSGVPLQDVDKFVSAADKDLFTHNRFSLEPIYNKIRSKIRAGYNLGREGRVGAGVREGDYVNFDDFHPNLQQKLDNMPKGSLADFNSTLSNARKNIRQYTMTTFGAKPRHAEVSVITPDILNRFVSNGNRNISQMHPMYETVRFGPIHPEYVKDIYAVLPKSSVRGSLAEDMRVVGNPKEGASMWAGTRGANRGISNAGGSTPQWYSPSPYVAAGYAGPTIENPVLVRLPRELALQEAAQARRAHIARNYVGAKRQDYANTSVGDMYHRPDLTASKEDLAAIEDVIGGNPQERLRRVSPGQFAMKFL